MAIKAILFDKDGTLIDVNATWIPLYRELLAAELELDAHAVSAKMEEAGYDPVANRFRAGSILAGGTTRQLVDLWWPDLDRVQGDAKATALDAKYAPLARERLSPLMDLQPVLQGLRDAGFLLGVGTNDSYQSALGQIDKLGVAAHFSVVIGADSVEIAKPSGQMIAAFASHLNITCEEVAMVGDNIHDLEEAKNGRAGLGIAVLTGNGGRDDLEHHADHVVDSVADLLTLLKGA
jgi:phosphoglycolate phosphatase